MTLRHIAWLLVVAAVAWHPATAQPRRGGTVVYATGSGPATLDPHASGGFPEIEAVNQIYETLIAMDEGLNPKPSLARSVTVSPDATTFSFDLRQGVRFHNGKEMTSADVAASYRRYQRVSSNTAALSDVDRFETPDAHTFVIHLKKPNSVFLDVLKSPAYPIAILPSEQENKPARENDVVGTGPFQLGEWVKDSHYTLKRFDGYALDESAAGADGYAGRKQVYLDGVRVNFIPEANGRIAALQSGGADIAGALLPALAKRLADRKDMTTQAIFPSCQEFYLLHAQNAPTSNALIRKAIESVIDLEQTIAATGQVTRDNPSMLYSTSAYFAQRRSPTAGRPVDVAETKKILQQAGYKGERIVLQTNSNFPSLRDPMLLLSEEMKAAGMNVDLQVVDWNTNSQNLLRGTGGWNVTATAFCSQPLLGPQQWQSALRNSCQIRDDQVFDSAYERFFSSLDLETRKKAWADIENRVLGQAYLIKIADIGGLRGLNTRVEGIVPWYAIRFWNVWLK